MRTPEEILEQEFGFGIPLNGFAAETIVPAMIKYAKQFSNQVAPPVKPDFTEITLSDYEKLGDTFIDAKVDTPLTQWRIIAGMLSSIGFKIIKKQ